MFADSSSSPNAHRTERGVSCTGDRKRPFAERFGLAGDSADAMATDDRMTEIGRSLRSDSAGCASRGDPHLALWTGFQKAVLKGLMDRIRSIVLHNCLLADVAHTVGQFGLRFRRFSPPSDPSGTTPSGTPGPDPSVDSSAASSRWRAIRSLALATPARIAKIAETRCGCTM